MKQEPEILAPPQPDGTPGHNSRPDFTVITWGRNHDLVWASKLMPDGTRTIFQDIIINGYCGVPYVGRDIFVLIGGRNGPDTVLLYGFTSNDGYKIAMPLKDQALGQRVVKDVTDISNEVVLYNVDAPEIEHRYVWINNDWHAPEPNGDPAQGSLVTLIDLRTNGGEPTVIRTGV